jgi:hypothetical protein
MFSDGARLPRPGGNPHAPDAKRRVRAALAAISLAVLGVSLLSPFQPAQTKARLERLRSALRGDPAYRSENMGFWFDYPYLAFLDEVDRRVPKGTAVTVAVLVPRSPDLYRFQANYRLAPRRVVEERWMDEADVIATYKTEAGRGPGGEAIPGGWLWIRPAR